MSPLFLAACSSSLALGMYLRNSLQKGQELETLAEGVGDAGPQHLLICLWFPSVPCLPPRPPPSL